MFVLEAKGFTGDMRGEDLSVFSLFPSADGLGSNFNRFDPGNNDNLCSNRPEVVLRFSVDFTPGETGLAHNPLDQSLISLSEFASPTESHAILCKL